VKKAIPQNIGQPNIVVIMIKDVSIPVYSSEVLRILVILPVDNRPIKR